MPMSIIVSRSAVDPNDDRTVTRDPEPTASKDRTVSLVGRESSTVPSASAKRSRTVMRCGSSTSVTCQTAWNRSPCGDVIR